MMMRNMQQYALAMSIITSIVTTETVDKMYYRNKLWNSLVNTNDYDKYIIPQKGDEPLPVTVDLRY